MKREARSFRAKDLIASGSLCPKGEDYSPSRRAIQITCRAPLPACARTVTSSTTKPTARSRLVNALSGPADQIANAPPGWRTLNITDSPSFEYSH